MEKFIEFVTHHWPLFLALVLIIILLIVEETRGKLFGIKNISPQDLVQLLNRDKAIVIDLRDKNAYETGHIVGSIFLSSKELGSNPEILAKYKDKIIVLIDGVNTLKLSAKLQQQYQLFTLTGGIQGWRNAGFPLAKG